MGQESRRFFGIPLKFGPPKEGGQRVLSWPESRRSTHDVIREYPLPPNMEEELTPQAKKVLEKLTEAAVGFSAVFAAQDATEESTFYPEGTNREEIFKAAEENPGIDIISPFTVVYKDENGAWSTKPMHETYAKLIRENRVLESLKEAAAMATREVDPGQVLKTYLLMTATALGAGQHEESMRLTINLPYEPKISIFIHYSDVYTDTVTDEKVAAQAWVDILDEEKTSIAQSDTEEYQKLRRKKTRRKSMPVKVRAGWEVAMTGQAGLYLWSAQSQPSIEQWRSEMGSKNFIFLNSFEKKAQKELPVLRKIASALGIDLDDISDEEIKRIKFKMLNYHETAHTEIPLTVKKRLGNLAQSMKELYCDLLALQTISENPNLGKNEKAIALLSLIAQGTLGYNTYYAEGGGPEYFVGRSSIFRYFVSRGVVENKLSSALDIDEAFESIPELTKEAHDIIAWGGVKSAQQFLATYFDPRAFSRLSELTYEPPEFLRDSDSPQSAISL